MDSRKKILIVDDEQINLEFFDVMLSKLGFMVEKAENGVEALEMVRKFNPDLIILDNIMPKMSGWEVTKTLKNSEDYHAWRDVPIIMFSAMDDVKDKVEGFELGVDDYITKPYNFSEVLARIRAVLRNRELFTQIAAREARIALVEALNDDIRGVGAQLLSELDKAGIQAKAIGSDPSATTEAKQLAQLVLTISDEAKKQVDTLEAKVAVASTEREMLKKKEIELKTLEKQFRKVMHES